MTAPKPTPDETAVLLVELEARQLDLAAKLKVAQERVRRQESRALFGRNKGRATAGALAHVAQLELALAGIDNLIRLAAAGKITRSDLEDLASPKTVDRIFLASLELDAQEGVSS